jgi:hypothetical protein
LTIAAQRDPAKRLAPRQRRGSVFFGEELIRAGKTSSYSRHLPPELVHSAGAEPGQFRGLNDARSFGQLLAGPIKLVGLGSGPAKSSPHLAGLAHKLAVAYRLRFEARLFRAFLRRGSQGFLYGVTKICRGCQLARHSSSYRTLGIAPLAKSGVRLLTESDPHGPATAGRSSVPEKRGVPIEEITVLARERFQSW